MITQSLQRRDAAAPSVVRALRACVLAWLVAHVALVASTALAQDTTPAPRADAAATGSASDDDFDFEAYEGDEAEAGADDVDALTEDEADAAESKYGDVETIVVTGTVSQSSDDLTASDSIASFDSEDLGALGAQDISDLAAFTPNLEIVTAGATTPTFFIRGVGLNDFNSNSTGAVAIYQDNVPINAPAMQLPALFDVETVNVLRGPQGTGLARNASAGAIKIYSRKPTGDFGGYLRADAGNYKWLDFEGAVNAPVYGNRLSARFAFRFSTRDGTMENRCGDAPAFEDRVEVPTSGQLSAMGKLRTDKPWSICGEPVFQNVDGRSPPWISDIPEGLASRVNDIGNWAVRGTLLWEPTETQEWLFGVKASKRDEYARLGQSYGTKGFTCANGDVTNCGYPGQSGASTIDGSLGGAQGVNTYQPIEVRQRLIELAPCNAPQPGRLNGTCFLSDAAGGNRELDNAAKVQLAEELARGLDSQPWAGDFNKTGKVQNDTIGGYIDGTVDLFDGTMTLSSTTGYDHYDRNNDIDLDFSPETLFEIFTDDRGWQVTQSLKLEGQALENEQLRWDVGGWVLAEELNVGVYIDLGRNSAFGVGARDYTQDLLSTAGYVSLAYDFWENFTLDGGFRYNWERKKMDYELVPGSLEPIFQKLQDTWQAPTGTVRLTYRFRPDTSVFAKYTRGWKPGTYNATGSPASGVTVADPETIDSYEAGFAGSWLEDRLGLTANFFYYEYSDYQIFTAQQFAFSSPEFVILNAEAAEVYGAEVEATISPWTDGLISMRFGWLETQFLDFVQLQQESVSRGGQQVVIDRELQNTGNQVLNAPRFKVTLTAQQTIELGRWGSFTPRYDGVWTDTTYYDATEGRGIPNNQGINFLPENTIAQEAFWLHNIRVNYMPDHRRFELAFWVRNLTNKAYKTFAFDGSTFNNTSIYFVGDPRTFGGSATWNF